MNNSNGSIPINNHFSLPYDPNVYQSSAFLNGLSLNSPVDANVNPMAATNFTPCNYGFTGFGDSLNFPNFSYFNNQPPAYFPPPNIPTTSTPLATPTQTPSIYQQNVSQFNSQIKLSNENEIRSSLCTQKAKRRKSFLESEVKIEAQTSVVYN
ncbi:hypothetical protein M3Y97_00002700 [Aphelenchoides bicaudatus]|nr:hypothetical protein M3Y97_00002700 [Aphelenchoides bicaudatus]